MKPQQFHFYNKRVQYKHMELSNILNSNFFTFISIVLFPLCIVFALYLLKRLFWRIFYSGAEFIFRGIKIRLRPIRDIITQDLMGMHPDTDSKK